MAVISVRLFMGEVPLVSRQLLKDGMAVTARNVNLERGNLAAWGLPAKITTPTKTGVKKTIYRFGQSSTNEADYWFTWTTDVDVVRAPIHSDTTERTYFTGDGPPKKTDTSLALTGGTDYPMNAYKLGIPRPDTSAVTATLSGTASDPSQPVLLTAYLITYVSVWGEEGAAGAKAIGPVEYKPGQTITLGSLPVAPTGNYNITRKRIYRSSTGTTGSAYQFVAEIPVADTSYVDAKKPEQLGETIATMDWFEPPENGFGLTLGANGNAIMLAGKTIYPCVPFVLYAYPDSYQLTTESDIVGAGAFDQGFVILTKGNPYVITGVDPASYTMTRLADNQACVSKRSIVTMMGGVVYASPDGLWAVTGGGMQNLTKGLLSREQWQAYKPESMHCYELDGRYHVFYDTGTVQGQLIFSFGDVPYMVTSNQHCTAAYNDPQRDALYLAQGADINKWNAGTKQTYVWKSKEYRQPRHISFSYAKVEADSYPVTFRLYAGNTLVHTQSVASEKPFRLPASPAKFHSLELEGNTAINGVTLATSGEEIVGV